MSGSCAQALPPVTATGDGWGHQAANGRATLSATCPRAPEIAKWQPFRSYQWRLMAGQRLSARPIDRRTLPDPIRPIANGNRASNLAGEPLCKRLRALAALIAG